MAIFTENLVPADVLMDIFKRLPAKKLMQFRCVCKYWDHIIRNPHFAQLHHTFSKTHPGATKIFLISFSLKSMRYFYSINAQGEALHKLTVDTSKFGFNLNHHHVSQVLNGLICVFEYGRVLVCNITTHELVCLPDSSMSKQHIGCSHWCYPSYSFGFDPITNEYKVLCIWVLRKHRYSVECEVFTLGTNSWRKVDEALPYDLISRYEFNNRSVCLNGVIHWVQLCNAEKIPDLVAFDLRDEKFGTIEFPEHVDTYVPNPVILGGRLAFATHCMKLLILEDYHNRVWRQKEFEFPEMQNRCIGTTDTEELLLVSAGAPFPPAWKVLFYDEDGDRLSSIEITGLPKLYSCINLAAISKHVENLYPLIKNY